MTNTELKVIKPEPIDAASDFFSFKSGTELEETINVLLDGKFVLISDFYSSGLSLLNELHSYLIKNRPNHSFQEQRAFRHEFKKLSNLILLRVTALTLVVKKSPFIGWLPKLYSGSNDFHLSFPQIQGLNSSWQWYTNGIVIPGLRNKIYPYYGVYFPTRFEHLILFDNYLSHYKAEKKAAFDIGIGSGILSLLLLKHGFQKSFGTDINPNAIIGLSEAFEGTKLSRKIELDFGHLFGKWQKPVELIVFNPPWLPASHDLDRLDEAIYYNENLFPDFFEGAKKRLLPDGRIVLLFSNLAQITNVTGEHPIEKELQLGSRFELDGLYKKAVKAASDKTNRNQHWRAEEVVELWVLSHKYN